MHGEICVIKFSESCQEPSLVSVLTTFEIWTTLLLLVNVLISFVPTKHNISIIYHPFVGHESSDMYSTRLLEERYLYTCAAHGKVLEGKENLI